MWLLLILLVILAAVGVLGFVLKVALAVALGVFLGGVALAALAWWRVRRALRRPQWRRVPGSNVEVLNRPD